MLKKIRMNLKECGDLRLTSMCLSCFAGGLENLWLDCGYLIVNSEYMSIKLQNSDSTMLTDH